MFVAGTTGYDYSTMVVVVVVGLSTPEMKIEIEVTALMPQPG